MKWSVAKPRRLLKGFSRLERARLKEADVIYDLCLEIENQKFNSFKLLDLSEYSFKELKKTVATYKNAGFKVRLLGNKRLKLLSIEEQKCK